MDEFALEHRAKMLDSKREQALSDPKGIGYRLDILDVLIDELNADEDLKAIFGKNVSSKLAVFSDGKVMSIVEAGYVQLTEEQKIRFLSRLKDITERVSSAYERIKAKK